MAAKTFLMTVVFAALLAGCATYPDPRQVRMESLTQHYNQFDLLMAWDTKVSAGKTYVDGVVKNVRYPAIYDLEIWVAVLDAEGRVAARSMTFVIPRQLNEDELADFTVKLPLEVLPGTRLRFTYLYRASEGGEGFGAGLERGPNWMQSFDAVVPAKQGE